MNRLRLAALAASMVTLLGASSVAFVRTGDPAPAAPRAGMVRDQSGPARAGAPAGDAVGAPLTRKATDGARASVPHGDPARPRVSQRLPLTVSVRPECLTKGQAGVATIKTTPGAVVSATVVFPDGDVRGAWIAGEAGDDGILRLRFVVAPDVPKGTAKATAAGVDGRERRGTSTVSFRIEGIGGCGS